MKGPSEVLALSTSAAALLLSESLRFGLPLTAGRSTELFSGYVGRCYCAFRGRDDEFWEEGESGVGLCGSRLIRKWKVNLMHWKMLKLLTGPADHGPGHSLIGGD